MVKVARGMSRWGRRAEANSAGVSNRQKNPSAAGTVDGPEKPTVPANRHALWEEERGRFNRPIGVDTAREVRPCTGPREGRLESWLPMAGVFCSSAERSGKKEREFAELTGHPPVEPTVNVLETGRKNTVEPK